MDNNVNNDSLGKFKKPLFVIIGILVIGELIWGGYFLTRPLVKNGSSVTPLSSEENKVSTTDKSAGLVLLGPTSVKTNEVFNVDVQLTTDASTIGTDLILKYDPNVLEIVTKDKSAATVGKIYKDYPANSFDSNGMVTISGVASDKGFIGKGIFATLSFKAKTTGSTKISLDFKSGSTIDSNVTENSTGNDILKSVNNLDITIN